MPAYVVPHAPLLVDMPGREHPLPDISAAMAGLDVSDEVVLVTPHGSRAGVYRANSGSLDAFGLGDQEVERGTDEALGRKIADAWGADLVDAPLDHGAAVPLLLMPQVTTLVVCALPGWTGQTDGDLVEARRQGHALAGALTGSLSPGATVIFSGHTSAAITPRAPLTERPEGIEVHGLITSALENDPGLIVEIADESWRLAGSCGAGSLTALSHFVTQPFEIVARSDAFGVGYVVARSI